MRGFSSWLVKAVVPCLSVELHRKQKQKYKKNGQIFQKFESSSYKKVYFKAKNGTEITQLTLEIVHGAGLTVTEHCATPQLCFVAADYHLWKFRSIVLHQKLLIAISQYPVISDAVAVLIVNKKQCYLTCV